MAKVYIFIETTKISVARIQAIWKILQILLSTGDELVFFLSTLYFADAFLRNLLNYTIIYLQMITNQYQCMKNHRDSICMGSRALTKPVNFQRRVLELGKQIRYFA